jgi:hypothetical protein
MLCMLGSHHVHRISTAPVWHFCYSNVNILCIYVFYLYEHDGMPTCIAFTDSPVKRPEDDLYVGQNMLPVLKQQ